MPRHTFCFTFTLATALCLALPHATRAGDTATDNLAGGAVQSPSAGATASQLNALPPPLISPGGAPPPRASGVATASPPPSAMGAPGGGYAVTSPRGRSLSTASPFIGRILTFYTTP